LSWLGLHLIALLGFKNRLNVFINWVWNYLTYDRSVRLILDTPPREPVLSREIETAEPRSLQNALSESPEDRYNSEGSNRAIEDAL
jgi:hypothetical protein